MFEMRKATSLFAEKATSLFAEKPTSLFAKKPTLLFPAYTVPTTFQLQTNHTDIFLTKEKKNDISKLFQF